MIRMLPITGNPVIGAIIEGANGKNFAPNDASVNQELSVSGLVDDTHRTLNDHFRLLSPSRFLPAKLPAAGEFRVGNSPPCVLMWSKA